MPGLSAATRVGPEAPEGARDSASTRHLAMEACTATATRSKSKLATSQPAQVIIGYSNNCCSTMCMRVKDGEYDLKFAV